jgi:hypothetical protein
MRSLAVISGTWKGERIEYEHQKRYVRSRIGAIPLVVIFVFIIIFRI